MQVSSAKQKEMLRSMMLSRRFEETLTGLCRQEGKIPGMMILSTGQEAVGSGVCAALDPKDAVISNHRSHHHLLAKGADPRTLMAEIYGKKTGCNKGKSGTLHLAVPEINAICTTTVVGGGPPIAAGVAFALQYQKQDAISVCFFGDGAANEGSIHEAMNLAALWRLPLIFVVENNLYAGAQRYNEHTRIPDLATRAKGYGMAGDVVDGNDAPAVYIAARKARENALAGGGPTLLECKTYRWRGHGETDPQHYQPKDEIAEWRKKCPILRLQGLMLADGLITEDEVRDMDEDVAALVDAAVRFAEESPFPEPKEALDDVWADSKEDPSCRL